MKKSKFYSFLHELIMGDDLNIKHKLQNMLLTISILGSIISFVIAVLLNDRAENLILSLICLMTQMIAFYISAVRRRKNVGMLVAFIAINLIIFPMMFYGNGGVYSGMPIWFTFGLIYPWLVSDGAMCIVMFLLNALMSLVCFGTQYFFPELFVVPTDKEITHWVILDSIQVLFLVALILGMAIKYQVYVFECQRKKLLEQEKQLREAMSEADNANSAKSVFLARMSHEIRTPINAVLGMDEMILRECSDETILSYAENIRSSGQSLLAVINDVLDFSKIESGMLELIPVEYGVQKLMSDCFGMIIMLSEKKNLLLEIHNDPDLPSRLIGDEIRVRQIMINLLTNAVKYTSAGKITMTLDFERISEDKIILKVGVRDTGMGISPENKELLFSDFNRLDETTTRNIEGTGLGLSICKRLVDEMNGKIGVESTLGVGSYFWFEIPQKISSDTPAGRFTESRSVSVRKDNPYREKFQAPAARILVVDDVKLNIDVLKGLLKNTRVRMDAAYSGRECLGLVQKHSYDLIFMDHLMPEMDGVQTLKNMRRIADCPNHNVPVIALTANAMSGAKETYKELGFTDYLSKPVQSERLELLLMKYLPADLILPAEDIPAAMKKGSVYTDDAPEFDSEAGLRWCCGDKELFCKILCMANIDRRGEQLDKAFRSNEWHSYEKLCCGLKSTSRTVGGERLSQLAASMEKACKSKDISFIHENHRLLIDCCRNFEKATIKYLYNKIPEGDKNR